MAASGHLSDEQVAVFEAFYAQCPSPSATQMQQIKLDNHTVLKDVDDAQIQDWFKTRRSLEKNPKEEKYQVMVRERLMADKNVLMEENVKLKKKVIELMHENDVLRRNRTRMIPVLKN